MSTKQPDVTAKELIRILEQRGFAFARQTGSHAIYRNMDSQRVTIPVHGKRSIGKGLLRQILDDAGMTMDELKAALR